MNIYEKAYSEGVKIAQLNHDVTKWTTQEYESVRIWMLRQIGFHEETRTPFLASGLRQALEIIDLQWEKKRLDIIE